LRLILQRYHEFEPVVYSTVQFSLHGGDLFAAHRFLNNISSMALNSIRMVNLHWCAYIPAYLRDDDTMRKGVRIDPSAEERRWEQACQKLSTMGSLQRLHIIIFDKGYALYEDCLLEPLRTIHANNFMVQLPWPWGLRKHDIENPPHEDYRGVSGEGCNFRIIRPSGAEDMVLRYVSPRLVTGKKTPLALLFT
jgi:hypothetical protein